MQSKIAFLRTYSVGTKGVLLLIAMVCFSVSKVEAQYNYDEYKEMYLGWIKVYHYKGASKPVTVDNKTYSVAQLSVADSFANWMQDSYTPKGALGDIRKFLSPKKGIDNANQYNNALPHSYGTRATSYVFLKKVTGKYTPVNNLGNHWSICANEVPISYRISDYCTDEVVYFTQPSYRLNHDDEKQEFDMYTLPAGSSAAKYLHTVLPRTGSILRMNQVILTKDNISPFEHVTIGEVLDHLEVLLPYKMKEELKNIQDNNIGRTQEIARLSEYTRVRFEKMRSTAALIRERYRNRRMEPAYTYGGILSELENGYDIFTRVKLNTDDTYGGTLSPVLRVKPRFERLCSSDKPQWITVKWWGGSLDDAVYKHMHESILYNFDFDYLYQFFFEPEKLKSRKYKALRSPVFEPVQVTALKSSTAKKAEEDPAVFFFEDFSGTPEGHSPAGWKSTLNELSKSAMVKSLRGEPGNWVEVNGQYIHVNDLGKDLPANFRMSFEICVEKDFHWGVPGLETNIVGDKVSRTVYGNQVSLRIRPGFGGRDGWATVSVVTPGKKLFPGEVAVPGFSNDKPLNKVSVVMQRNGTRLTVWVGSVKVLEMENALQTNTLFDHFYFYNSRAGWEVEAFYISNIRIEKI